MADEAEQVEMTTEPGGETLPETTQTNTAPVETISRAEFEKLQKALKEANAEAAKRRKELERYEKAEQERKEAEMTDMQRLQAQLEKLQAERDQAAAELKQRQILDTKRKVAREVGLPEALAERLAGDNEEALTADAKAILEALPKAPEPTAQPERKPTGARINPTNPGPNATGGDTDEQLRSLIYGQPARGSGMFTPDGATRHGGGVVYKTKPE